VTLAEAILAAYPDTPKNAQIRLAEDYNSFIDNNKNLNSEVQFVMQTEEIKIDKSKTVKVQVNPDDNLTFFQRILRWFKK